MRVTAAGSLPGTDFAQALTAMVEALPDLVPWPELPARGVASGMIGRALGLIDGLGFDLQPAGWRLVPGSSADHRRARAQWRRDLDDAEERLQGFEGTIKVAVSGPWTLAASVERPMGDRLLADYGARRELAQALSEAVGHLRAEVRRRLPAAEVLLQIDEPALIGVALGTIPTASGFGKHRAVSAADLAPALRSLADGAWLHCCAPGPWLSHARAAGFAGVAVDTRCFRSVAELESLTEWVHDGRTLAAGVVDTSRIQLQRADELVTEALRVLRPLELQGPQWAERVALTTACGLANWPLPNVPAQLTALARAGDRTAEALQAA